MPPINMSHNEPEKGANAALALFGQRGPDPPKFLRQNLSEDSG
jgi:hypothetical protein